MAQIIFVRHGESSANVAKVLAGRTPGVTLTDRGRTQARALAPQLRALAPALAVRSTLPRCEQTAALALPDVSAHPDPAFDEVDYGSWSGRSLSELGKLGQWRDLMRDPAGMAFPDGESLAQASERTLSGVRRVVAQLRNLEAEAARTTATKEPAAGVGDSDGETTTGGEKTAAAPKRTAVVVAHGDIVKFALLDALGLGVAGLHRITVATGSMSVVDYSQVDAPMVCAVSAMAGMDTHRGTLGG